MELLKKTDVQRNPEIFIGDAPGDDEALERIRCPLCSWRPTPSSSWRCWGEGTPEPPFDWCGTSWNTFLTRGRCPGCRHQWQWTSCLRCHGWSLHEDWYDRPA
jgi:hypothetical protein